ncbi:MAG: pimeloyl-ACP methyl ester carboxylesterase [Halieaceae bacterium]|jgi:pimeloyl-ACP methyl ester carboxylesterase
MKNIQKRRRSLWSTLLLACLLSPLAHANSDAKAYGNNLDAGDYFETNGIKMYYEVYGAGEPMVLIHGSGQDIAAMHNQIEHFAKSYKVLVADSRAHGKSGLGEGDLTYLQMADDWAALIQHLRMGPANIVGWSDGGNIGLRMAVDHPKVVAKLATMGANLQPDESAVEPWAVAFVIEASAQVDAMIADSDTSQNWKVQAEHLRLLREQPDMSLAELASIEIPVLIMAGDKDVIRAEHSVLMFQHLPKAHLAIFPGDTHFTPELTPTLFNSTVDKFMLEPYARPDTKDIMLGDAH